MAVNQVVKSAASFIGYSSDTKPANPPAGSKFQELNTGKQWIFDGTYWAEDLSQIYALTQALLNAH